MKRAAAILFLVLYIFTVTECNQLLKLPVLLEHYTEHKKDNRNISFPDFIYMHYAGDDFNDNDEDRDKRLPFKAFDTYTSFSAQHTPSDICTQGWIIQMAYKQAGICYADLNLPSSYLKAIWQPPKA